MALGGSEEKLNTRWDDIACAEQAEARRPPWLAGSTPPRLTPLLLEGVPSNGVTLGGIHGMVRVSLTVLPRRDRGRAGPQGWGGWIEQQS